MRTITFILFLLASGYTMADNGKSMIREIARKTKLDAREIRFSSGNEIEAMVSFSVRNKKIRVHDVETNDPKLKELIKRELYSMKLSKDYQENKYYQMRFVFEPES